MQAMVSAAATFGAASFGAVSFGTASVASASSVSSGAPLFASVQAGTPLAGVLVVLLFAFLLAAVAIAWCCWRSPARIIGLEYRRQRRALGFTLRSVRIGEHDIAYVERAAGHAAAPCVVMIHGYTGSKENWYLLAAQLGTRYRLVAPDLPGWGQSQRLAGRDYGFSAQAEHVAAFLRALGDAPVALLGHSMGGGIAALVAARHPALVSRLALIDAAGVEFAENRFGLDVLAGRNPFAVSDRASLERYLDVLFHDRGARPAMPWPGPWLLCTLRRRDADFEQSVLERIGRSDERFLPWQQATQIRQPTLLAWGRHDRVIDPSAMARYAQQIPQARTLLLEHSGHMTVMEEPAALADAVVALIEEDPVA